MVLDPWVSGFQNVGSGSTAVLVVKIRQDMFT